MLSGDLPSVSHITLKLGHIYLVTHVVYPVSPRLCLPPAVPLATIEITTSDPKGSLPTYLCVSQSSNAFPTSPWGELMASSMLRLCFLPLPCTQHPVRWLGILKHVLLVYSNRIASENKNLLWRRQRCISMRVSTL